MRLRFGWNVIRLLSIDVLVIASGFLCIHAYLRYPADMTANLAGETLETMLLKVADLERKCKRIALDLPDEVNPVMSASNGLRRKLALGGSFRRQLAGIDPGHPMRVPATSF